MYVPEFSLYDAESLEAASEFIKRHGSKARLLAGGTDLFVDLKTKRVHVDHLISIQRIATLHGIEDSPRGLRIGALTTISQLNRAEVVRSKFRPLIDATSQMAAPQVRNAATVGGNIASAVPCADLPPILTAMNASVTVWSDGHERSAPLESFIVNVRETRLQLGEILTAVFVPHQPARFGAAYARFALRDGNAIAVASVAASLRLDADDKIQESRLVLGAVSPVPVFVSSAASAIKGCRPGEEAWELAAGHAAAAARPICDVRGSADYRREIVVVLTKRALWNAYRRALEREP